MKAKLVNGDSKPYWDAAAEGRLVLQKCTSCQAVQFPPGHICRSCWETKLDWVESSGKGRIESCTIVHRPPSPAFKAPYVIAMVRTEEDVRITSNIIGEDALSAAIDDPVQVTFEANGDGQKLPQFQRLSA